jgi:hypothetical protein
MIWPLVLLLSAPAQAQGVDVGGYLRVSARPDLQGGDGKLGYWNLYGRLLNEGPYAAIEMRAQPLPRQHGSLEPWTSLHLRVEGGSVANAEPGNGSLGAMRLSQLYALAGNVLLKDVTWRVGSIEYWYGDLGLYDMRPAHILDQSMGLSTTWERPGFDLLLGLGDSGYGIHGADYHTVLSGAAATRIRLGTHLELGLGGQYNYEPKTEGNRLAPHVTPGVDMEDLIRGEVVQSYFAEDPDGALDFPDPVAVEASSSKLIAYLGFGQLGPLRWNNCFASLSRLHPELRSDEDYQGESYTLYTTELTDERTVLQIGNELQLRVIPQRLDLAWGLLYGDHIDGDNDLAPSDHSRRYASTVLRTQLYLSPTLHWLMEGSLAQEFSKNGNQWREHADSIFENTDGVVDGRGLETGDTDTRMTVQAKGGLVLSPQGAGIYARPSLRLLYGAQHSNINNAYGNSFVEDLDQYNEFGNVERHWHHVIALETEAWF